MVSREEIREGMGGIELGVNDLCGVLEGHVHLTPLGREKVLYYLHSQGVVIKVVQKYPLYPPFIYEPLVKDA